MGRLWRKIKGFPNYSVSDDGLVRNDLSGMEKVQQTDGCRHNYLKVDLYNNGFRTHKRVHKLVAEAFIPNPDCKTDVNHKDGNTHNNSVNNLEWVTRSENVKHAIDNGLWQPSYGMLGKHNPNAGRKGRKVRVVETGVVYDSIIACELNTGATHVYDCLVGLQHSSNGLHFEYAD